MAKTSFSDMFLYEHEYICVYVSIYVHMGIFEYILEHAQACVYAYICICRLVCICIYVRVHVFESMFEYVRVHEHVCIRTNVFVYLLDPS